ncbi:VanZ family protein [Hymenobacter cheonanensis]|uniref:VanZ family protein n=1 Tax=Hymenobacter sp. CA2-7 TaxID=3063993 RepID=UPI002712AEF4|nr:VanZ family protein [Hymenobacter sp. CA2-7]MDO7887459.1 VanZ family protein [Hymenobacter sp. CA2-7]
MKTLTNRFAGPLTLLWVVVMLVLTLTPAQEMPRMPEWKLLSFDTAAHAGVFAVLAGLAWLWARQRVRYPVSLVLLGCIVFGALIEVLQYAMQLGRHAEWTDLLSDTIGAALVLAGASLAGRGRRLGIGTGVGLALGLLPGHSHAQAPEPDLARARRTIEALAAPTMHGRGYVQQGEHVAAAYLRGRLRQLGLAPLAPDYMQSFTLDVNTFPGKIALTVGGQPLAPGRDFIAAPESGPWPLASQFQAALLDTLVFIDSTTWRQYLRPYDYRSGGRPKPTPATILRLSQALVIRNRDESRLAHLPPALRQYIAERPHFTLVPKLTASLAAEQAPHPHLEVLASSWPAGSSPQLFTLKLDAQLLHHYQTQNLAALIKGTTQPDSFLVVSAHYDHLGMMGRKTYFPGANDNASGVALLLELAAHYARPENRPAYSLVFLLFGAEEAGLVGSGYFVQHPLVPLASIKFLLNLDLLGTGEEGATVVNGRVYEAAFARLTALNNAHHYLPHLTARGRAANSDHFPFSEAGVPAFFLYTRGGSLAYHDVNDQPAALSLAGFAGAYGLARDFLDGLGAR